MQLLDLTRRCTANGVRYEARVASQLWDRPTDVYFDYASIEPAFVADDADACAPALLLPAMRAGEPLSIPAPLSTELAFNLPRVRDIFHTWWPHLFQSPLHISARTTADAAPVGRGGATFFSGGVDSLYTLLKHRRGYGAVSDPLTHVLFLRGVEARLERTKNDQESARWVQEVAAATGTTAIFGITNIRTALQGPETLLHWERHYHGSALASIGLTLAPAFRYVCIPSAFSYNHLVAHGSSPLADEMFSSGRTRIVHDGSEVSRAVKVARIVQWDRDLVLSHLRVCIKNSGGAFNCGRCYKCVRTAIPLRVLGVWADARTFPDKKTDHWEAAASQDHLALTEENLQFAREYGAERWLVSMLERVVRRRRRLETTVTLVKNSPLVHLLPLVRRLRLVRT